MKETKKSHVFSFRSLHPLENYLRVNQKQVCRSVDRQQVLGRSLNTLCTCQNHPVRHLDLNGLRDVHQNT